MATLALEIYAPEKLVTKTDAVPAVKIPGSKGTFEVLPQHASMVSTIDQGIVSFQEGTQAKMVAVRGGFAQIQNDRVKLLVDEAFAPEDVSAETLKAQFAALEEKLADESLTIEARAEALSEQAWIETQKGLLGQ